LESAGKKTATGMLILYTASWRHLQEARTKGHQGDQEVRNTVNGTKTTQSLDKSSLGKEE